MKYGQYIKRHIEIAGIGDDMLQKNLIYQMPIGHKCWITKTRGWHTKCYVANNVQETQFDWKLCRMVQNVVFGMMDGTGLKWWTAKDQAKNGSMMSGTDVQSCTGWAYWHRTEANQKYSEMCKRHQWVMSIWSYGRFPVTEYEAIHLKHNAWDWCEQLC